MSVISTVEAVPYRLAQMWLFLATSKDKQWDRNSLAFLFSPPALGRNSEEGGTPGGSIFDGVFKESVALGLIRKEASDTGEIISAGLMPSESIRDSKKLTGHIRSELRNILTDPERARQTGQDNLPLALAWLMIQSSSRPLNFGDNHKESIMEKFNSGPEAFDLRLQNRYANLYYWARYLGLCTIMGHDGNRLVVPDPTDAILDFLPKIFEPGNPLLAREFMNRLGQACPVLEYGQARAMLLFLATHQGDAVKDNKITEATSLAILRLEARGILTFEDRSDAPDPVVFALPGSPPRRCSHMGYTGGGHDI